MDPKFDGKGWLKEVVCAVIGLSLLFLLIGVAWRVFETAGQPMKPDSPELQAYVRQKDVLTVVLGLFGAVSGYYLGSVRMEQRAKKAEDAAEKAQDALKTTTEQAVGAAQTATKAVQDKAKLAEGVRKVRDSLKIRAPAARAVLGAAAPAPTPEAQAIDAAAEDLDRLLAGE